MKYTYTYKVWNNDTGEIKEVLVVAKDEKKAENKLDKKLDELDCDDYELQDENWFDLVIS